MAVIVTTYMSPIITADNPAGISHTIPKIHTWSQPKDFFKHFELDTGPDAAVQRGNTERTGPEPQQQCMEDHRGKETDYTHTPTPRVANLTERKYMRRSTIADLSLSLVARVIERVPRADR